MNKLELKFLVDALRGDLSKAIGALEDVKDVRSKLYDDEFDALNKCMSVLYKISIACGDKI